MLYPHTPAAPRLDAIALVNALRRDDTAAVEQVLTSTTDIDGLAIVLGRMVGAALRTDALTVEQFIGMEIDAALGEARPCSDQGEPAT